jgi:hypothetical protein
MGFSLGMTGFHNFAKSTLNTLIFSKKQPYTPSTFALREQG